MRIVRFGSNTAERRTKVSVRFAAKQRKSRRSAYGQIGPIPVAKGGMSAPQKARCSRLRADLDQVPAALVIFVHAAMLRQTLMDV
jgi:hypothetical protein